MSSEGIVADPNMPVLAGADLDGLYLAGGARTLSLPHDANAGRRVRLRDSGRSEASAQDGGGIKGARMGSRWVVPIEISGIALFFPIRCRYDR